MTQDEFRAAMNAAKRENRLLWVTNSTVSGIALGYDSGTNEAVLFKDERLPLDGLREVAPVPNVEGRLS
jgi:hypothetical protein